MYFDSLIVNGIVVDGTGNPREKADIGIVGDRVAAIGHLVGAEAEIVIDASGKIICPGFIDVHVHSELALLDGRDRYAPLKMGVTTQLSSPDGFSWAPLKKERLKEVKEYLHVFYDDDLLDTVEDEDLSIDQFLSMFHGRLPSNLALQVPHLPVRVSTMGWEDRRASDEEIAHMEMLVRDWMEAGAVSFCTGLEYEPMRRADLRELVRLSQVATQYNGIYVAHQRGYGANVNQGCQETFLIAELADIPVHISHFTVDDVAEAKIKEGVSRGIDISFDMYPYPAGCTHLLMGLPEALQAGAPEKIKQQLQNPTVRRQMTDHLERAFPLDRVKFAAVGSQQPTGWEGKTLGQVMDEMGMSLVDTVCEILLATDLQALMIYHWLPERWRFLETTFKHPLHMVATDGLYVGRQPHPRGFGSFPKVLGEYVRENEWLSVEQAVYKMSGFPATKFNIKRRGVLKKDYFADIVIFDPGTVSGPATFVEPRNEPVGIDWVFVNGKVAMRDGTATSGFYGKII